MSPAAAATPTQDAATRRPPGSRCVEPGLARERDDARRLIELFELAQNLRLLCGEPLGRKGGVGGLDAERPDVVEPAAELDRALGADVAPIEVRGTVAGHDGLDERRLPTDVPDETLHQ